MIGIARRNLGILVVAACSLAPLTASASSREAAPVPFVQSPMPTVGTNAALRSVAAVSASDAWAVGLGIERWNGKAWAEVPVGTGSTSSNLPLNSVVSVPDTIPAHVWAVGSLETPKGIIQPRILKWNGKLWASSAAPNLPGVTLTGVTAISGSNAWAVGATEEAAPPEPVILHWNGGKWSQVASPVLINGGELSSIDASGPQSILAVGWYHNTPNTEATLVERWNGHKWSILSSPSPSATDNELTSVTAVPGGSAWAVGFDYEATGYVPLAIHLVGNTWVTAPPKSPRLPATLAGVAAAGKDDVWAVGVQGVAGNTSLTEHWNGSAWKIVSSRNQPNGANRLLSVAAIPGSNNFWSVGGLAERWNGTRWSSVRTVNIGSDNDVEGVAVTNAGGTPQAWVAGSATGPPERDVVWHWNGSMWKVMILPGPGDYVTSVGASGSSSVFVGGSYYANGENVPSVHAWNGQSWSRLPSPAPPGSNGDISSLDALSANDLWATGEYETTGNEVPLLAKWNGVKWTSVTATCPVLADDVYIDGISAVSDTSVWAAGYEASSTGDRTLILHWNGATCTSNLGPSHVQVDEVLRAILARPGGDVWAVGSTETNNTDSCLTEHLAGSTTTIAKAPSPSGESEFAGVASAGGAELWAVGGSFGQGNKPLVEWWDGSTWHVNHSAVLNQPGAYLFSAAGTPNGHTVWAVGQAQSQFGVQLPFAIVRRVS